MKKLRNKLNDYAFRHHIYNGVCIIFYGDESGCVCENHTETATGRMFFQFGTIKEFKTNILL